MLWRHDHRTWIGVAVCYAAVVFSGLKGFALWDQMRVVLDADPWSLLLQGHAHGLRFLVVQPAVMMSRWGLDPDPAWTLCCVVQVVGTALLCARAAALEAGVAEAPLRAPALAVLGAISMGMHGRLIPAFLGVALALAVVAERRAGVTRWTWIPALMVSVLLASVSSGTMAVAVAAAATAWWSGPGASRVVAAVLAIVGVGLVAAAAYKALAFFHGDVLAALGHGPGGWLAPWGAVVTVAGCVLLLAGVGAWSCCGRARPLRAVVVVAVAFGLFGWSTLAVGLVPVLVLLLIAAATPDAA